jgi:large subunit ribosomal protein L24
VQTTLLGLAIAFILALVAALVGPFFIDWSQFRPQFEAEATRIVGAPVRVVGALDARLLPAPSLQLHGVTIGGANDLGRFRAEKLDVEFSLGSLMRGEWRATELTVGGLAVDLGLNAQGRLDLPASTGSFNLGALAIDRLNVTGRINLHDAASRSTLELSDIAFSGDVRSLAAGAMRGDGNFTRAGIRHPFRMSSGQTGDGNGTRLRFVVDANEKSPGIDLDGVLSFDNRVPGFDGALTVGSAVNRADANPSMVPWRIVSKVKADPSQAQFETVDVSYGTDDGGLKLAGVADYRFGASPLLHAVLSAKQFDADRLLAKQGGGDASTLITALRKLTAIIPQPTGRTQIQISADQVMLGGRPVQSIGADLHGDTKSWTVERLEFRAPGATRVIASGAAQPGSNGFAGAVSIDSADPDLLADWLKGRSDGRLRDQKPLRIRGNFTSSADRLAVDGLKAEIDGGTLEGRIALNYPSSTGGSRIEAELRADRLDLDAATALARSLSGPQAEWPDAGKLSLDIGRAVSAGQEMRPFAAQLVYGPKTISLDRFKVGEASGLMLDGSGTFDRNDATGKLMLDARAPSLAQISKIIASFAPDAAKRIDTLAAAPGAAKLKFALDLTKAQGKPDRTDARMSLDIDAPQIKGDVTIIASPTVVAARGFDGDALSRSEFSLESRLTGQGGTMLTLLGLNGSFAAGDAPLLLEASAAGAWHAPMRVKAKLSGAELDADVQGTAEPFAKAPKATLTVAVRSANAAPLLGIAGTDPAARASLSSRLSLNGDKLNLDDIDTTVAGSRLRGRLALTLGSEKSINGQLGVDSIDLALALGWMIGARGHDASDPLGGSALPGWRGQVALQALRASLPGGAELQPLSGNIKSDGRALTIDEIKGKIGGGDLAADLDLKPAATGYALGARVTLTGADGSALRYRGLGMPAGKTSLKMSVASQGRSASALEGAVSGDGLLTVDGLRIGGLDPGVFDVAILASDSGQATDDARLKQIIDPVLARGEFAAGSAQIPFSIKDSRLRVGAVTLESEGARTIVSGGYDIVADQVDIRASLVGAATGGSNARPEIQLFLMGPPDRLDRTVEIASLSSWLAVRAIDRETRRLDLLERGASQSPAPLPAAIPPPRAARPVEAPDPVDGPTSTTPTSPDVPLPRRSPPRAAAPRPVIAPPALPPVVSQQIAPLPAPIEIRPAPGTPRAQPKQRPAAPLVLTPPAAVPLTRPSF